MNHQVSETIDSPITPDRQGDGLEIGLLTTKAVFLESVLLLLGLILGWFGFYYQSLPLGSIGAHWLLPTVWGILATIPLIVALLCVDRVKIRAFREIRAITDQTLIPMFRGVAVWKLALISICAGVGEEMLFRWAIQGGTENLFSDPTVAMVVSIAVASIIFGLCHWLNLVYAWFALIVGIYLGLLMIVTGSIIAPILTHALYDFVALIYITKYRKSRRS